MNWLEILRRVISAGLEFLAWGLDTLLDWMEFKLFRVIRLFVTFGLVWFAVRGTNAFESVRTENFIGIADRAGYVKSAGIVVICAFITSALWSGAFCDGLAGILLHLIDSPDDRPIDTRDPMDRVARLVRAGKRQRAIRLCRRMLRRRQGSPMVLNAMIERLSTETRIRLQ